MWVSLVICQGPIIEDITDEVEVPAEATIEKRGGRRPFVTLRFLGQCCSCSFIFWPFLIRCPERLRRGPCGPNV